MTPQTRYLCTDPSCTAGTYLTNFVTIRMDGREIKRSHQVLCAHLGRHIQRPFGASDMEAIRSRICEHERKIR